MFDFEKLGFSRYRTIEQGVSQAFKHATGCELPPAYLEFLGFREPSKMPLSFKFLHTTGEEWEGQVSEFLGIAPHPDDVTALENQVLVRSGTAFLPIACDAGGNYLYLNVTRLDGPVVDVDYASGAISEVASNFVAFLEKLYPSDD